MFGTPSRGELKIPGLGPDMTRARAVVDAGSMGGAMAAEEARPSLRRWSLFAFTWHVSFWVGWSLVAVAAVEVQAVMGSMPPAFWAIAALVLLGELRPVRTAGVYDEQGTVTSTAFVFAILYLWGLWPALLLQAGVTVTSERVKRKPPWVMF